jgi:hypothetical protein
VFAGLHLVVLFQVGHHRFHSVGNHIGRGGLLGHDLVSALSLSQIGPIQQEIVLDHAHEQLALPLLVLVSQCVHKARSLQHQNTQEQLLHSLVEHNPRKYLFQQAIHLDFKWRLNEFIV